MRSRNTSLYLLLLGTLCLGAGGETGTQVYVHEVKVHLMPRVSRFGRPVKVLGLGAELTVIDQSQVAAGWLKVRTRDGHEGWVPVPAITYGDRNLRSADTRTDEVRRGSVQLAARGFSEDVERESRKAHPELDYRLIDAIEASQPDPGLVTEQARRGGVRLEAEQ